MLVGQHSAGRHRVLDARGPAPDTRFARHVRLGVDPSPSPPHGRFARGPRTPVGFDRKLRVTLASTTISSVAVRSVIPLVS